MRKEVNCAHCGEPITEGYNLNPQNSDFCDTCADECPKCGDFDVLEDNGMCYGCGETIIK